MTGPRINDALTALPVYPILDTIAESLARDGLLMLHAETGAGKTTLVPWRLLKDPDFAGSKIILLQPRRIAARAAAERIAAIFDEPLGRSVGLRTRLETIIGPEVRLEVATEGVLTRIIQNDQSLAGYGTVIFDEFHERNLQADTALAFAWDCRETIRPDLRILFMSATLPAQEIRSVFGDMEFISVPGRAHPVEVFYRPPLPGEKPWEGAARLVIEAKRAVVKSGGDILVFLPGFREINRTRSVIEEQHPHLAETLAVLHGQLPPEEQRRVLKPAHSAMNRVILSTNVAETSLTIPGVRAVVDCGLERRVRYLARTGMDHWDTAPISTASAEQRKGRAGRNGPGVCYRWWDETDSRIAFSPPEILESDLAPLVLETALWGAASPFDLRWLTPPPRAAALRASTLLHDLGLIDSTGRITGTGRRAAAMGLHPRLGRMVEAAAEKGWLATAALTAAILEEGDPMGGDDPDFRDRLSAWAGWADGRRSALPDGHARRIRDEMSRILKTAGPEQPTVSSKDIHPELAGRLIMLAYPDRVAGKTGDRGAPARWVLTSGRAARAGGPIASEEFLVAAELDGGDTDARIILAAPITRDDIEEDLSAEITIGQFTEWDGWAPKLREQKRLGKIILWEKPGLVKGHEREVEKSAVERLAREGTGILPWNDASRRLCARVRFVRRQKGQRNWPDFSPDALSIEIEQWLLPFGDYSGGPVFTEESIITALRHRLGWEHRRMLEDLAPDQIALPSGSRKHIDYESGEIPVIAARIQEFFGAPDTPRICGEPVLIHLLSPAGRPMQITRDLDGFWDRSYPEIKKELMGRYPKHYWPDNPRDAEPTSRAKPRKK